MKLTTYAILGLIALTFSLSSCYKKKDTIAIVKVVDSSGDDAYNARVILYGSGSLGDVVVRDTVFTNTKGEAEFNYNDIYQSGQAGVAVLDIQVTKGGLLSQGIIKVVQEETTREKVIL